jgi:hypothetical protein
MIGTSLALTADAGWSMSQRNDTPSLVETVRAACLEAALAAYEDAGIRGLCAEGRWEAALAAIRHVDLSAMLELPADSAHDDDAPVR